MGCFPVRWCGSTLVVAAPLATSSVNTRVLLALHVVLRLPRALL